MINQMLKNPTLIAIKKYDKSKKRRFVLLLIIVLTVSLLFLFVPKYIAYAENMNLKEIEKELTGNVEDKLDKLDLSELESFVRDMENNGNFDGGITAFIRNLIKGDYKGGYSDYFKLAIKGIGQELFGFLPMLVTIVAVAIIFSILQGMSSGFINKTTTEIIYFVCYSAIIVILITKVTGLIATTAKTIGSMTKLMDISFPILLTLITALGGIVSVSVYQPMMAVVSTAVVGAINAFVIPCFVATMVLSVVGHLTKNIKLERLTKFFKSAGAVTLGLMFSLFITFVTMQGITGAVSDNISVKSAKFAISSYVPILGGYLSDGFDLVMASVVLIKNALGMSGVLIMLSIILAPVIKIVVFTLGLKLIAGIIEPIGDKRMSDIIGGISENMVLLVVAILGVSFMFFIMIMLVIYTCNMGVI